jgi:hypothetical protein
MTTPKSETTHIGNTSVRLLVPSRRQDGGVINAELRAEWDSKARSLMGTLFGGTTPSHVQGAYQHDDGRCTREEVTVLTSSCSKESLSNATVKRTLINFATAMCGALGQESVFVGWGEDSYVVSLEYNKDDVPVIQFCSLNAHSQIVHLTMGWAGINEPEKILQVLSLDGWTAPDEDSAEAKATPWRLCGLLQEEKGERRAWAWLGGRSTLKGALASLHDSGPREGDLVFSQGEPHYIEVSLVGSKKLIGPRDLRLSHGQLNPVTRHLLFRMLRREWDLFESDLKRKPLDQMFFPRLQSLRAAVEKEILVRTSLHQGGVDRAPSGGRKPARKAKKQKASHDSAEDVAFRESVLVVGRMMFLRFLIQKGWIPGGLEKLKSQCRALGDDFFSEWIVPLWFDALNQPEEQRTPATAERFGKDLPYLNGGLFMPRPHERSLSLPAGLFDDREATSFLGLFEEFEFSLNENDGSDNALKIDPSFFGKALESFNPDHEKKRFGVHYTPKPIARALAAESIVARVAALADVTPEQLYNLLRGTRSINGKKATEIRDILSELTIVDPAVGSGVLLWAALRVLLDLDSACDGARGGRDGYQPGSYEWGVRSRHFVCNCLYGVDISDEAVELSRLRLWLAVALSEDSPSPLPDLELNICRGDSLLGQQPKLAGVTQMMLGYDEPSQLANDLRSKTKAYVEAGADAPLDQRHLRREVLEIRRRLAQLEHDPGQEPTFDWALYFPHVFGNPKKRGFDIVVANPPYVRVQKVDKRLIGEYRVNWPTIAKGSADLSFAFVELAARKLAAPEGGQIAFIQPNFRHHDAAKSVRSLLTGGDATTQMALRLWVDFDAAQVFPTASNYVSLLFAERTSGGARQETFAYTVPDQDSWEDPDDVDDVAWIRDQGRLYAHPVDGEWLTVIPDLRDRVLAHRARCTRSLGDIAEVHVGIQTSADGVFLFEGPLADGGTECVLVCGGTSREALLEKAIVRRCVKGAADDEYWLLFPYDAEGELLESDVLARQYPKAWRYLQKHRTSLESRESGKFRDAAWYRFGRDQGFVACASQKVIVPSSLKAPKAIVDQAGLLAFTGSGKGGGGAWAVQPKAGIGTTCEQLAAILEQSYAWDHFVAFGSPQKGGWRGVDRAVLASVPIPD